MDRSNQSRRPFGYIISNDHQTNYQNNPNLISPTPTDPGHLNFSSNGPTPSHSPISVKDYPIIKRIAPQQACFKIDSYYRKPNDNYIKTIPKTERQKSRRQRIAQLDDAIFELEQMYAKLKLSDQDLLDRADRREVQSLIRFNSASRIPAVSSPTQLVKSDEELINQQRTSRLNSNNELNKRRPISAFYNQFQRAVPLRRSGVPDLVNDDQAVRRLNSPLPPKNPVTITPSYLQTTPAYAKPLNMQHQKKKNIYGHLEFDPIVDDVQYRKMSQNQMNLTPHHPPIGIPLNIIKTNPINDYLHSNKTNDMAVRSLRKDYSVNQTNPFAHVLHRSSSSSFFQQHQDENELLPETTTNYLINVKKQLKPTRSSMSFDESQQIDDVQDRIESQYFEPKRNPFLKSSSFSNSLSNQHIDDEQKLNKKPKNNIYKKQISQSLRNDTEEQLENMLSNLNKIPKQTSPDVISTNKYGIINRASSNQINKINNVDLINRDSSKSLARLEQSQSQTNLPITKQSNIIRPLEQIRQDERRFGLMRSPTELISQSPKHKILMKSHTQGDLINKYDEFEQQKQNLKPRYGQRVVKQSDTQLDQKKKINEQKQFKKDSKQSLELNNESIGWSKEMINKNSETNQKDQWSTTSQVNQSNQLNKTNQINELNSQSTSSQLNNSQILNSSSAKKPTKQKHLFVKSSSIDQSTIDNRPNLPYLAYLTKRSNTQVDKMKNLFESKFSNEGLFNVPNRRYNSKSSFATKPKKSSTQPNLMNYKLNDSLDKKKKKLRKLKSSHALLNRSLQFSNKSNQSSDDENFSQFTDESEHETSSSSYDS